MRSLGELHPLSVFCYFAGVMSVSMLSLHPALIILSLLGCLTLLLLHNQVKARTLAASLGLFTVLTLLNPLFYHDGITVLFVINDRPFTLEALLYGAAAAGMILSMVGWFRLLSRALTSDRLLYLLGRLSPRLALMVSMALRFVPAFARQGQRIHQAQQGLGLYRGDNAPDALRGLSLTVRTGEIFCLLGGNGSGKSTALACAAKLLRPYAGTISMFGKKLKNYAGQSLYQNCLALLPQDVQTLFLCSTVAEELQSVHADTANFPMDFTPLLNRHPYDLSGGEQQALALCKALAARPRLLLLDEPTKGLDACARERMTALLQALRAQDLTVLCVTHDVAFAAACADRCALFFRGEVVSCEEPHAFFAGNHYYTTAANRMARGVCDTAICAEEVAALRRPPEAQP